MKKMANTVAITRFLQANDSITKIAAELCQTIRVRPFHTDWQYEPILKKYTREITMFLDNRPAWYAKTVITEEAYNKKKDYFGNLSTEPLGAFLFSSDDVLRLGLNYQERSVAESSLTTVKNLYALKNHENVWLRRSTFLVCGELLLLTEVFLPGVLEFLCR
jgi:chorismate-pyruvate lyase